MELRRIQVACSLHGGTRPLAGEGKYHHQARRQRSGGNPLYSHHEEFTGHGGNRGSRQVPSFMDRQAHFDNADHHEGHDTEHSIRHCEADLHERRSGAQYPEFQHIHDRRRHRKRTDRLYFGAVRERPACGGNGGEGGKAGYSGSDKCPHGQAYLSVYEGRDLTAGNTAGNAPCIFSQEFDNIVEQEYTNSVENLKTTAYVGGEEKKA